MVPAEPEVGSEAAGGTVGPAEPEVGSEAAGATAGPEGPGQPGGRAVQ